ncbi:Ca2+-binding RTX toxin-like protein [Bradyrhizobium sp. AZCC 1578]|uniref:beta strand repeat-containing protein n=1 Tax=Bradyrhizobium sp. AZCC 1578 TaxID=3117027 RepID=UPI002FEF9042
MATYTHTATAVPSAIAWYNVTIDKNAPVGSPSSTLLVLPNSDGTETRIIGTGFTYSGSTPTGGTISEIDRTSSGGGTIYETVTGLSLSLVALTSAPADGNRSMFALIFQNADTFNGFAGNDYFVGGAGADSFVGGGGTNTVSYDNALAQVRADLGTPATNTGDAAGDTYSGVQNLIGSDFNDLLFGNSSINVLSGGKGNDFMGGGGGNDTIDGGTGIDTANYANATAGITAVLSTTSSVTGNSSVGTDTLISVEQIRGSGFADNFTATSSFSGNSGLYAEFEGMGGDDVITGNGVTRVAYSTAASGVAIDLLAGNAHSIAGGDAAGIGIDSFAGVVGPDNINAVNGARGSNFADTITAAGARGFFQFIGFGGNDTLTGSTEAINNFDHNVARYDFFGTGVDAGVVVVLDTISTVTDKAGGTAYGTDTLINIERVRGTSLADSFTANAGFNGPYGNSNFFEGGGGNDSITGNGHTWAQYSNALAAVTVNLQTGVGQSTAGGDAAGVGVDTITGGVNGVLGSHFDDTLIGSNGAQAEQFYGDEGNDNIDGGGGLLDRVVYRGEPAGVTVNLLTHSATDGYGNTDTLTNIEGVVGTEFNDVITGDGNDNRLIGQNGDDQLFGGGGNDFLVGDDGVDLYANAFGTGGQAYDSGNDTLDGGTGADQMWGGKGNDTYVVDNIGDVVTENANQGTDTVQTILASYGLGSNVENLTFTDSGAHTGSGNELNNLITGGSGNDTIFAGGGNDTLNGGDGNDVLVGNADVFASESDSFNGGNGNDTLYVEASDTIQGGAGQDFVYLVNSNAININLGTTGIEWIQSDFGNDVIDGSTQTVGIEVYSDGGNDTITGSAFNDIIWSGSGNDTVTAGDGDDVIVADIGVDSISGGNGNDSLYVDASDTFIDGGAGFDAAYITSGSGITLNLATTHLEFVADFVPGGGNDTLDGSGASANLTVYAAGGTDTVTGGSGADFLWGGAGNDTVTGNGGNDTLVGEAGADQLTGGAGTDNLYGNAGNGGDGATDTFVFADNWGTDFVFDFEHSTDKLDLSAVTGVNSFSDITLTNTPDGHCYVSFAGNLIAVANMAGQLTQSDFLL